MQCTLEEKNTLYAWTPELDEELRDIYATSASRRQLALRMSALVERTGFPRTAFQGRTNKLNLRFCFRKSYTPAEVDYIEQNVGPKSIREVAKDLGRSWHAVAVKSRELGISAVARPGRLYSDAIRRAARRDRLPRRAVGALEMDKPERQWPV